MTTHTEIAAGAASALAAGAGGAGDDPHGLVRLAETANTALLNGEIDRYFALIRPADDFTLMAPFGGPPRRGFNDSPEFRAELARFFKSGRGGFEVVQTCASDGLVVLAVVERQRAEVGGLPEQDWSLRVTLVFRRDRDGWQLVHRHADPLVRAVAVEQAAAIARGDGAERSCKLDDSAH